MKNRIFRINISLPIRNSRKTPSPAIPPSALPSAPWWPACCCFPSGLICGAIGIVMAIMSRNADIRPKKSFCTHAVIGLVLCAVAVALTFFVCYAMIAYYSAIREPEKWPYLSEMIKQFKQVFEQVYGVPMDSLPMP